MCAFVVLARVFWFHALLVLVLKVPAAVAGFWRAWAVGLVLCGGTLAAGSALAVASRRPRGARPPRGTLRRGQPPRALEDVWHRAREAPSGAAALSAGAGAAGGGSFGVDALSAGADVGAFGVAALSAGAAGAGRGSFGVDSLTAGAEGAVGGAPASPAAWEEPSAGAGAAGGASGARAGAPPAAEAPPPAAAPANRSAFPTGSLYCFSLLRDPLGPEARLLDLQRQRRTGPFGCDESAVWTLEELQGDADWGPPGGGSTAGELARLWGHVVADGGFRSHAWTVRVDPDCVFFPGRLRWVLSGRREEAENGVYMTGCAEDDSPIQVLSRRAVEAFGEGSGRCGEAPGRIHLQPSGGEDAPVHWCLSVVLGVRQVSDRRLLLDSRCGARDVAGCAQGHVAFHPLETEEKLQSVREGRPQRHPGESRRVTGPRVAARLLSRL
ncbi:unnamed protein product [Prorocentrum cordatum]|uniref:Hexosyltransferase n=1 Tax=Prorocentrum cordatum TaxID=2364126 RepID=A0ABN9SX35_9DINO|nr:unnamed protein product [Polarella glacialis]